MQQYDSAGMNTGGQLFKRLCVGWLLIHIPVYIGQAPEKGLVAQIAGLFQILLAVFPLGRTVKFHHILAGGFLVQLFQGFQFLPKSRLIGNFGHNRMMKGMVAYRVALRRHPLD